MTDPAPRIPGLRERKRRATVHRLQEVAVRLFDERGFDAVTIEEVAREAEVSPSTVYRHFGTKEGLVIHDEHDDALFERIAELLPRHDLADAALVALDDLDEEHFVRDLDLTIRRTRYMLDVPSVRAAALLYAWEMSEQVAVGLELTPGGRGRDLLERRAVAVSFVLGLLAGIEEWYRAGADEPVLQMFTRTVAALR